MDESSVTRYITETFDGVETVTGDGVTFFMYDPGHQFPNGNYFATIMTKDNAYDDVSRLDRPGVYRLNIGVSKATADALVGPAVAEASAATAEFTAPDRWMPHPHYASAGWICILNPSDATFEAAKTLLAEAYDRAVRKYDARAAARKPAP